MTGHTPDYDPLQAFIDLFKDVDAIGETKADLSSLSLEDRLRAHIIDGTKENLAATLDEAMAKYSPLDIINDHLLDGMKTVGELFGSGQMQLPFVLQSAEVMKQAVAHLEPHMERKAGTSKGSIVLATVKGDVHDIGKNLVDIILSNNGYTVHNIGIKQPLSSILEKWKETEADAIGMSGLLVKSVNVMEENLRELAGMGFSAPILLGGAALTRHYCEGYLRTIGSGPVFYGKDAFEGLRTMDCIMSGRTGELATEIQARLAKRTEAEEVVARSKADRASREEAFERSKAAGSTATIETPHRSDVRTDIDVPTPPFWGSRIIDHIPLDEVYPFINTTALFRGQWQFKKGGMDDAAYDRAIEDKVLPVFERLKKQLRDEKVLTPKVVYGYFPCQSDGDDLVIYDPESLRAATVRERSAGPHSTSHHPLPDGRGSLKEIERFRFPRQDSRRRLCIADFFKSTDSGEVDVIGLSCVTMGSRVSEVARKLFESNTYQEYLYIHGMGVETAEALAELWHKRMRAELGIGGEDAPRIRDLFTQKYRGSRYSPGYPACPDMADQEIIWRLIGPERIGCTLTENWQIDPEQSTSAFIVHHPDAKYFNV